MFQTSTPAPSGKTLIRTIINEDPYSNFDCPELNACIEENGITFAVNSILRYSGIWQAFEDNLQNMLNDGYRVVAAAVDYGKDRTQDQRPCTDWHVQDAAHPLGLLDAVGLENIQFETVEGIEGYLSVKAGDNGEVIHTVKAAGTAEFNGETVAVEFNGTFDYKNHGKNGAKTRNREITVFLESERGQEAELRLNFDERNEKGQLVTTLTILKEGKETIVELPEENKMVALLLEAVKGQSRQGLDATQKVHNLMKAITPSQGNITKKDAQVRPE